MRKANLSLEEYASMEPLQNNGINSSPRYKEATRIVLGKLLPLLGERAIEIITGFANNVFLAWSPNPLTLDASNLTSTIQSTLMTVNHVSLTGVGELIAELPDNENEKEVGNIFRKGLLLSFTVSAPTIILTIFSKPILVGMGQNEAVSGLVQDYFRAYVFAIPAEMGLSTEKQLVNGLEEKPWGVFIVEGTTCLMTSALGYLLINGVTTNGKTYFDFGISGLGYATVVSSWINFLGFSAYLGLKKDYKKYELFRSSLGDKSYAKLLLLNGLPLAIQFGLELGILIFFAVVAGWISPEQNAAQQIGNQYILLLIAPLISLSQANLYSIAHAKGIKRERLIRPINIISNSLGLGLTILAATTFAVFNGPLVSFFVSDNNPSKEIIINSAKSYLWISGLGLIPDAVRYIGGFGLVALEKPIVPMLAGIMGLVLVATPLSTVLALKTDLGLDGIAIGRDLGVLIGALMVLITMFRTLRTAHIVPEEATTTLEDIEEAPKSASLSSSTITTFGSNHVSLTSPRFHEKLTEENIQQEQEERKRSRCGIQ